ncbi:MAG: hypothetical protein PHP54_04480 [Clostridia bacterium]|nr:hypothetical protein [Clostridia bacterium]
MKSAVIFSYRAQWPRYTFLEMVRGIEIYIDKYEDGCVTMTLGKNCKIGEMMEIVLGLFSSETNILYMLSQTVCKNYKKKVKLNKVLCNFDGDTYIVNSSTSIDDIAEQVEKFYNLRIS